MKGIPWTRRGALALAFALWAKAQEQAHQHNAGQHTNLLSDEKPKVPYRFKFLSPTEVKTVQRYAAVLVPATDRSGGAAAAAVEQYVDHVLANAAASLQRSWRRGLNSWAERADAEAVFQAVAPREFSPKTADELFFSQFKNAITAAFYTSEEGITKELGYQGLGFLREYKGYQGEQFTVPAGYTPRLKARS